MAGTQRQKKILDEKQDVRGELNPLAKARSGGVFPGNGDKESSDFRSISVPEKTRKIENLEKTKKDRKTARKTG